MDQGSALGPDLWNAMYDGVLKVELPEWAKLIGYVDDIAAIIGSRDPLEAEWKLAWVCKRVKLWFGIAGVAVPAGNTVKYLGEKVDRKVTHWPHTWDAAEKA